jgi:hypothetical protein
MSTRACLLCLTLAGCASARPESAPLPEPSGASADEGAKLEAYRARLVEIDGELRDSLAEPKPRCDRQCTLSGQVCELATLICTIAQRHADDPDRDYATTCRDGRARCERARQQVASCACSAP